MTEHEDFKGVERRVSDRRESIRALINEYLSKHLPCANGKVCKDLSAFKEDIEKYNKINRYISITNVLFTAGLLVTFFIYLSNLSVTNEALRGLQATQTEIVKRVDHNASTILQNTRIIEGNKARLNDKR